jgi:cephalosporin-C deacetylase-like acetyl esterase
MTQVVRTFWEQIMLRKSWFLPLVLGLLPWVAVAGDLSIRGTTDKPVAIYKPGEKMVFTLHVLDAETPAAGNTIKWTRTGDDGKTDKGEGVASEAGLAITTSLDKPGFVRIEAKAFGPDGKPLQGRAGGWDGNKWDGNKNGNLFFDGGACVEPEKMQPVVEPADFDVFWKSMRARLAEVPVKAELKEVETKNPKVKLYAVRIDCPGPRPVTGYMSMPANAKPKSLPGIAEFQGYGIWKHSPPGRLNESAIFFEVNAHGMELARDDAYYKQLEKDLGAYCFKNNENVDREKTYYYGMALRVMRALEYIKSRPEWNGKELQSNGGSQGGLQGLWGAGLDGDVTSSTIWSPWSCDFGGVTLGRLRGWLPDYREALNYYDPVFHAKRIKAQVSLVANYGDYTCTPASVWLVYNAIPRDNKSMEVKQGCTHGYTMKHHMRYVITPKGVNDVGEAK